MNLCVWFLRRLSQWVLVLNVLVFVVASAVMASSQEQMLVFLEFPWGSFLTELSNIMHLGLLDARSVWIAWLFLNVAITFSLIGHPHARALSPTQAHQDVARLVKTKAHQIESDPHLKQSLKKLNQLLNKP
jgi:hypothetical protein